MASRLDESPLDTLLSDLQEIEEWAHHPLRCMGCGNPVTSSRERCSRNNQSCYQFVNPGGYQFNIELYSSALGCYPTGQSTGDFSWFPPFVWRYAKCGQCDLHLGWHYQATGEASFWGLIRALLSDA